MMIVKSCLRECYEELPQPEFVLSAEDDELSYFLWTPGLNPKPHLREKMTSLRTLSSASDTTIEEVLEEMVEMDVLESKFNEMARGGSLKFELLGPLARQLGGAPSNSDLAEFSGKSLNLPEFKEFMAVSMYSYEDRDYFQDLLRTLENVEEGLTVEKFENVLRNYGEPLTDEEMAQVLKLLNLQGNVVTSGELVDLLRPQ